MNYPNANQSGAVINSIENRDVTWEKNGNLNVGVEFRLFDRLTGTVEWYNRKTTDLLLEYPMAISLGFPAITPMWAASSTAVSTSRWAPTSSRRATGAGTSR